jgi:hypothetical protein
MRAKKIHPSTFEDFYAIAPAEIKEYLNRCATTLQSKTWHPEGDALTHIKIVFNRAKRTGDINLMLAALFHDLGKADVTRKHPTMPDKWSAKMHELVSTRLVKKHKDWIESLGGDFDIIFYLVDQHMRVKHMHEMRPSKREVIRSHPHYDLINKFTEFDNMQTDYSNDID